jgi:hypothetical protein
LGKIRNVKKDRQSSKYDKDQSLETTVINQNFIHEGTKSRLNEIFMLLLRGLHLNFFHITYKNSSHTPEETHYVFAPKIGWLMFFRETIAVCNVSHTKHTNTFCVQNTELRYFKVGGIYSNYCDLKG